MTDFSPPDFLPPDSRVGPWLVESYASHGTYGLVYKASRADSPGSLPVALKEALLFRSLHEGQHDARYHASAADDLFALGVSLYRLVAGLYPPPETPPGSPVDPYRAPAPPRRALRELNPLLEPWLAALIERLLSKEPSQRGFALEHERAALAVAQHAGPEADAPLVEALEMSKEAVPEQAPAPVASPSELAAASARAWTASGAQVGLFAAILALIGGAILLSPRRPPPETPQVVEVEQQDGGSEPDAGTRGLGDGTATTRVEEYGVPAEAGSKALALQMPDGPLDGQMRPPCKSQSLVVVINGGCWIELKNLPPHCGHDEYEWKNGCYYPFMERNGHPRTSKDPQ